MKIREKFGSVSFPGWLFVALMALYNEVLLHIWVADPFQWGRFLAVCAFGLGFGGILALVTSLLPWPKASKWIAVGLSLAISVAWLTEYFVSDAYQVFMTPKLIAQGAGGVAEDYLTLVLSLLGRNLWRIGLLLVPIVLYALFCRDTAKSWKLRTALVMGTLACYLLGWSAVTCLTRDASRFTTTYSFDSAIRCFGLHVGMALEITQGGGETDAAPSFVAPTMPTMPEEPDAETEPTEVAPIIYDDNIMTGWDPEALAQTEKNQNIATLHSYVASLTPSKQNEYTGLFAGKNLILITAEAFTAEVIDPELTPTLYRLANEGIQFTDYYQPAWGASTTSGEFSNLIGLVPATGGMCMKETIQQHLLLTMGHQLQRLGYSSVAYHNNTASFYDRDQTHTYLGYDQFLARSGGLEGITPVWPESDLEMIDITVPQYIDNQPFSVYYMTVSGHSMYSQNTNAMAKKNYDKVKDLDYSETVKCYLAANLELESAMASLIQQLEEAGIADDTVIVMATDHYPYGLEPSETWKNKTNYLKELFGVKNVDKFVRDHNRLIIWSGCIEGQGIVVDDPVYSLDILPTISNLFGVEYDSRLLVGRDVFSGETPLVLWQDHSWITDKGTYDALKGEFTPAEGAGEVSEDYIDYICSLVANKITYSKSVQNYDYFNYVSDALGLERN